MEKNPSGLNTQHRDKKEHKLHTGDVIVQSVFAGFSILVLFLVFGVIFFVNPEIENYNEAYACDPPPTATPSTYSMTFIDRSYYYPDNNPEGYLRAGINIAKTYLANYNITLNCPTIQNSAAAIDILSITDTQTFSNLTQQYGNRWSDDESVWMLVGRLEGAFGAFSTSKKDGVSNGWKLSFIEQGHDANQIANIIIHEIGHEAGLNHTNDSYNFMYKYYNENNSVSTSIAEIESGGLYGQPLSSSRNQEEALKNIWNYNDKFSGW